MKPCEVSCPKCGSSDIYQKYYAKGDQMRIAKGFACVNYEVAKHELLYTICRNCQYSWEVQCLTETKS